MTLSSTYLTHSVDWARGDVGGLIVSQVLTLYATPVIYLLLDRLHRRLGGKRADLAPRAALPLRRQAT